MDFRNRKRFWLFSAAVLVLGGAVLFWSLNRESDEAQVRQTLRRLCRISSKSANGNALLGAVTLNGTDQLFAPKCQIDFRHEMFGGVYTPIEIASTMTRAHSMLRNCIVDVRDILITIEAPDRARAVFTGTLDGRLKDGRAISEVRDLFCTLEKREDRWLITNLSVRDVLEK